MTHAPHPAPAAVDLAEITEVHHELAIAGFRSALRSGWWEIASDTWAAVLTPSERLNLLAYAIRVAPAGEAVQLMDAAVADMVEMPDTPFGPIAQAAIDWVRFASEAEIKHFAIACINAMGAADRLKLIEATLGSVPNRNLPRTRRSR